MTEVTHGLKLAVLGLPIAHSLSPAIHEAAYRELQLDWTYTARELGVDELSGFLDSRDDTWHGFSVTMPLKRRAFELSTKHDEFARRTGVVNTLIREGSDWSGHNTDVPGAMRVLRELCSDSLGNVCILGGGATAASLLLAVQGLDAESMTICARRAEAFEQLRATGGEDARLRFLSLLSETSSHHERAQFSRMFGAADVVINTLPAEAILPIADDLVPKEGAALFDVTYNPHPTPLSELWERRQYPFVDGRELLVQQAVLQVRLFLTGTAENELPNEAAVVAAMRGACMGE